MKTAIKLHSLLVGQIHSQVTDTVSSHITLLTYSKFNQPTLSRIQEWTLSCKLHPSFAVHEAIKSRMVNPTSPKYLCFCLSRFFGEQVSPVDLSRDMP